jgi:hypothetical protein
MVVALDVEQLQEIAGRMSASASPLATVMTAARPIVAYLAPAVMRVPSLTALPG